jgi:hypothetical protein
LFSLSRRIQYLAFMGTAEESQYLWEPAALSGIVNPAATGAIQRSLGPNVPLGPIVGGALLGLLLGLTPAP